MSKINYSLENVGVWIPYKGVAINYCHHLLTVDGDIHLGMSPNGSIWVPYISTDNMTILHDDTLLKTAPRKKHRIARLNRTIESSKVSHVWVMTRQEAIANDVANMPLFAKGE